MSSPQTFLPPRRALLIALAAGALSAAPALHAQESGWFGTSVSGSGTPATEPRAVSDFRAIAASGGIDVIVRQTGRETVEATADDNLLPLLETVVESGREGRTLLVRWKKGQSVRTRAPAKVTVEVRELVGLSSSGSGDIDLQTLKTPSLVVSLAGSGDAVLGNLSTGELSVRIAGSGDVRGNGSATGVKISVAGSGDVALDQLAAEDVSVSIAGSGDVRVAANRGLTVSIAGSGDVTYTGNPATLKTSVAGSGTVNKR